MLEELQKARKELELMRPDPVKLNRLKELVEERLKWFEGLESRREEERKFLAHLKEYLDGCR